MLPSVQYFAQARRPVLGVLTQIKGCLAEGLFGGFQGQIIVRQTPGEAFVEEPSDKEISVSTDQHLLALGIVYAGFGMMLILTGLMGGLVPGASFVGETLGQVLEHTGDKALVMAFSAVFGFVAMYLEPAVWVWGTQVTNALGGSMKRHMLVGLLCLSGAMGGALGMAHVLYGISVWGILGIGYLLALGLTLCTPRLYIGIAFDAGGVVIGPVSLFFLLTFVVGVSHFSLAATQGSVLVVMACIAMVPLVILQLFGLIFSRQEAQAQGGQR